MEEKISSFGHRFLEISALRFHAKLFFKSLTIDLTGRLEVTQCGQPPPKQI